MKESGEAQLAAARPVAVGLGAGDLDAIFPFHFAMLPDGRIAQAGPGLVRLCPDLVPGQPLERWVQVHRPAGPPRYGPLASEAPSFIILRLVDRGLLLRGQTLLADDRLFFLGTPWVRDLEELAACGLGLGDFPPHDPLVDFMMVLRAKDIALNEASAMAERLDQSRQNLETLLSDNQRIRSRLEALVRQLPWGLIVEDEAGLIALANQKFCEMFGLPFGPDQLLGLVCASLAAGAREVFAKPEAFDASTARRLAERTMAMAERFELKDGRVLERDYVPVVEADGYRGHLWQYRDVTEAQRVAAELEEARARAELANVAKDEFLAMMSHEMRTPLGVIIGLSELLQTEVSERSRRDFLQRLDVNARSLMKLIEDTLDLARLEAREVRIEVAPFDPRTLVEEVSTALCSSATGKGLELIATVAPDVPQVIIGDEHRWRQILVNLAGNAIKFTDRGEVAIDLTARPLDEGHVEIALSVADSGPGVPEGMREAIFDRFVRVEGRREGRGRGTGLGLPISRKLAAAMGGAIDLESTVGRGSVFTLKIPSAIATTHLDEAEADAMLEGWRVGILSHRESVARSMEALVLGLGARALRLEIPNEAKRPRARPDLTLVDGALDEATRARLCAVLDPARTLWLTAFGETPPCGEGLPRPLTRAALRTALEHLGLAPRRTHGRITGVTRLSARGALRLLVAEDDPDAREVLFHLLTRLGHGVDVVTDGAIALEKTRGEVYDLLLTDLRMPRVDGLDLIGRLREQERNTGRPRLPIIALSADALSGQRAAALASGADEFVAKPVQWQALQALVNRLGDRRPVVMMVDDAADMRMLTRYHLESEGQWRMLEAGTAKGALDILTRRSVGLVLLDLGLPDLDGLTLLERIRALPRHASTPLVVMSGRRDDETVRRCLALGAREVLLKPVERTLLLETVARYLQEPTDTDEPIAIP